MAGSPASRPACGEDSAVPCDRRAGRPERGPCSVTAAPHRGAILPVQDGRAGGTDGPFRRRAGAIPLRPPILRPPIGGGRSRPLAAAAGGLRAETAVQDAWCREKPDRCSALAPTEENGPDGGRRSAQSAIPAPWQPAAPARAARPRHLRKSPQNRAAFSVPARLGSSVEEFRLGETAGRRLFRHLPGRIRRRPDCPAAAFRGGWRLRPGCLAAVSALPRVPPARPVPCRGGGAVTRPETEDTACCRRR